MSVSLSDLQEYCKFCKKELLIESGIVDQHHLSCISEIEEFNSYSKTKIWKIRFNKNFNSIIDQHLSKIEKLFIISPGILILDYLL